MNTFTLKIIALILMVVDHIGLYFQGTSIIFRLIGRGSYPLFLFCMVWGYHYTKNRKKYLLRLYIMSIFMTVFRYTIDSYFITKNTYGNHNIFLSMFLVGILISIIEIFQKDRKKGSILLGLLFSIQILYYIIPSFIPFLHSLNGDILTGIIPNLALNEYGFEFVSLGVLMYFLRDKKDLFCIMYLLFCVSQFSSDMLEMGMPVQCFMFFALPFMMQYNHQKGLSLKYFFYLFYPTHTFLLFYFANFIFGK